MEKRKRNARSAAVKIDAVPSFRLPGALSKIGEALLEQQMWCWGCDVRRREGNLLCAYGFEQRPSPEPRCQSAYTISVKPNSALTLWGWGLWIAAEGCGSLFLSRSGFRVRAAPDVHLCPQAWHVSHLPPLREPRDTADWGSTLLLLHEAVTSIAAYESWLTTQVEIDYRERTIAAWPQRRRYRGGVPAADVVDSWTNLSQIIYKELDNGWKT